MTFPAVQELLDYWRAHPPVHLSVAAALGQGAAKAHDDFAALMAMAPKGVLAAKG